MPNVISRKMHLDTVFTKSTFREEHDTGAVHNYVHSWYIRPGKDLGSCSADGLLAGEVDLERTVVHVRELRLEGIDALLDL